MSSVFLVTGSEGFLGRHVVAELSKTPGVEVVRLGRHQPAVDHRSNSRFVCADLSTKTGLKEVAKIGPDAVVHLAWEGLSDFRSPHHVNQVATHVGLFEALISGGIKRVVGVGTCLEYGLVEGELDESLAPRPVVAYADGKTRLSAQSERLAADAGASWCWARVFYPYGPGQQPQSLWGALNSAIDRDDREFPMSAGEQVRDYLHVRATGRILAHLALNESATGPINVCSGEPVTVRALVHRWISERGARIRPAPGIFPYPDYEPMSFWGSTRVLESALATSLLADGMQADGMDDTC